MERWIQTIGKIITKCLPGKGETWPLYAVNAPYAMNTSASPALSDFLPLQLVLSYIGLAKSKQSKQSNKAIQGVNTTNGLQNLDGNIKSNQHKDRNTSV